MMGRRAFGLGKRGNREKDEKDGKMEGEERGRGERGKREGYGGGRGKMIKSQSLHIPDDALINILVYQLHIPRCTLQTMGIAISKGQ